MGACLQIDTLNPPIQSSQVTGIKPTQEYPFKLRQKMEYANKKSLVPQPKGACNTHHPLLVSFIEY